MRIPITPRMYLKRNIEALNLINLFVYNYIVSLYDYWNKANKIMTFTCNKMTQTNYIQHLIDDLIT